MTIKLYNVLFEFDYNENIFFFYFNAAFKKCELVADAGKYFGRGFRSFFIALFAFFYK